MRRRIPKFENTKYWILENKYSLISVLGIYLVVLYTIGIVQYPYIDDTARQISGATNFWIHYSRFLSEIFSWAFQGSKHLTDQGVTNFVISGLILSITSIITLKIIFKDKKIPIVAAFISVFIGLNPWFLECLSFRFDSPFMALSIFFSVFPYLFWNRNKIVLYIISSISVLSICNTYQASSGIFIVYTLCLLLIGLLEKESFYELINKSIVTAISFASGMGLYLLEMKLNPELATRGHIVEIASLREIPSVLINNVHQYFYVVYMDSAKIWILIGFIIFLISVSIYISQAYSNIFMTIIVVVLYIVLGSILSYGVLLIFKAPLVAQAGRYGGYGLSVFAAVSCLAALRINKNHLLKLGLSLAIFIFMYFQLAFDFGYATMLSAQKESFEAQSVILANDLKNVVTPERKTVIANRFLKSPNILINSQQNFPILRKLVPASENLYWPNQYWFNNITGMNIELNPIAYDFSNFDKNGENITKIADNFYYEIYVNDTQIFVIMK